MVVFRSINPFQCSEAERIMAKQEKKNPEKECPQCHKMVGSASSKCKFCQATPDEWKRKPREEGAKKLRLHTPAEDPVAAGFAAIQARSAALQKIGGLEELNKRLAAIDEAELLLSDFGGVAEARMFAKTLTEVVAASGYEPKGKKSR